MTTKKALKRVKLLLKITLIIGLVALASTIYLHVSTGNGLPVLGYHSVVSDHDKHAYFKNNIYVIGKSQFEDEMEYLYEHDYKTLTMKEVESYYDGKSSLNGNCVCLTFDDGMLNFKTVIKPILKKYGFKATEFVIGHKTKLKNSKSPFAYKYLRKTDLKNDSTVQYYSHTYDMHHKNACYEKELETATLTQIREDFKKNSKIVSDRYFAYPYGVASSNAVKVLDERGTRLAFTYGNVSNVTRSADRYHLPRYTLCAGLPMIYFQYLVA